MTFAPCPDMIDCLAAIAAFARDAEIPASDRALRLAQYAACAEGLPCPEVAFDPIAIRLRSIAARLRREPALAAPWRSRVREVVTTA